MTTAVTSEMGIDRIPAGSPIDLRSADGRRLLAVLVLLHARTHRRNGVRAATTTSVGRTPHLTVELTDSSDISGGGLVAVAERARTRQEVYADQVRSFTDLVQSTLPAGASIAVVSRGDEALASDVGDVRHFPADGLGRWIGHHPADSETAIGYLREAVGRGATYLGVPEPSRWWMDHYSDFATHLAGGPLLVDVEGVGAIWALATPDSQPSGNASSDDPSSTVDVSGPSGPTDIGSSRFDAQIAYDDSVRGLRCWADTLLGAHRQVVVISRGDPDLVGEHSDHFPINEHGIYDGHPVDDADALDRLRSAYDHGAEFVLIPEAMSWWAEIYPAFWAVVRSGCCIERPGSGWLCDLARTELTAPTFPFWRQNPDENVPILQPERGAGATSALDEEST